MRASGGLCRQVPADAAASQLGEASASMLPLFPGDGAQPPPEPLVNTSSGGAVTSGFCQTPSVLRKGDFNFSGHSRLSLTRERECAHQDGTSVNSRSVCRLRLIRERIFVCLIVG
jgi:hypothetical protein